MTKPLVVFTHGGGRLGNQLINFAHLIAWVEDSQHEFDLINMAFWDYADLFTKTQSNVICSYPDATIHSNIWRAAYLATRASTKYGRNRGRRSIRRLLKYLFRPHVVDFDSANPIMLGDDKLQNTIADRKITFMSGWGWRNWELLKKHQKAVREFLKPAEKFQSIAISYIHSLRLKKIDVLVGVLIRQGDYRLIKDNKYLFETPIYVEWMRAVVKMLRPQKVGFIIATDEEQNELYFAGMDCYMATGAMGEDGHYIESLLELSMCDLIISPPSTFSAWAAFIGDRPLLPLFNQHQEISEHTILKEHMFDAVSHPHFAFAVK